MGRLRCVKASFLGAGGGETKVCGGKLTPIAVERAQRALSLPFGSVCLFVSFQWLHGAGLCAVIGDMRLDCAAPTFAMVPELTLPAVWGPRCAPVALSSSASGRPASRSELSMTQHRHSPETAPRTTRLFVCRQCFGSCWATPGQPEGQCSPQQDAPTANGCSTPIPIWSTPNLAGPRPFKIQFLCVWTPKMFRPHPKHLGSGSMWSIAAWPSVLWFWAWFVTHE